MKNPRPWIAYVGCRTTEARNAQGRGLAVYQINAGGEWIPIQRVEPVRNPSFLCLHPKQPRLYTVHGDFSEISTYAIEADWLLQQLSEQSVCGVNPVHLALTPSSKWLLVANYASGTVVSMPVSAKGDLGAVRYVLKFPGLSGPHIEQDGSHPHQIKFTPDGRFALVPDKGLDKIFVLTVDEVSGRLVIVSTLATAPGSGPRHMVFHPSLPLAYIVGELNQTVTTVGYDATSGQLEWVATVSTVPETLTQGSAAGIAISQDACRLFVSNRGHTSVAVYEVLSNGTLGAVSWVAAGSTPRFITHFPEGGSLLVAREDDHSIAALQSDAPLFHELVQTGSPVCIVFKKEKL